MQKCFGKQKWKNDSFGDWQSLGDPNSSALCMHRLWSWSSSFWQVTVIFQHSLQRCKQKSVLIKQEKIAESNIVCLWTECRAHETLKVRYWNISKRNQKEKEKITLRNEAWPNTGSPCVCTPREARAHAYLHIQMSMVTLLRAQRSTLLKSLI